MSGFLGKFIFFFFMALKFSKIKLNIPNLDFPDCSYPVQLQGGNVWVFM
jgi:hypothetical protein